MAAEHDEDAIQTGRPGTSALPLALTLAALVAIGAGLAYTQFQERKLSKLEKARLRFYRYLRERGRLES